MRRICWSGWLIGVALAALELGCGSDSSVCDNDALVAGCTVGKCRISSNGRPLPSGGVATVAEIPVPSDIDGDALGKTVCQVTFPTGTDESIDVALQFSFGAGLPNDAVLFEEAYAGAAVKLGSTTSNSGTVSGNIHTSGIYGLTREPAPWSIDQVFGGDFTNVVDQSTLLHSVANNATTSAIFDGKHLLIGNGNRVLVFDSLTPSASTLPSLVIGQPDMNTTLTQTTGALLSGPVQGMWSDGTRLAISQGNRILVWQTFPSTSLQPADFVLGQPDFISNAANIGGISAATLASPSQIDSDGTHFIVADTLNQRLLLWQSFPSTSMQPADVAIGQPNFVSNVAFNGSTPLYLPYGAMLSPNGTYASSFGGPFSFVGQVSATNPTSQVVFNWQYDLKTAGTQVQRSTFAHVTPSGGIAERDSGLMRVNITRAAPSSTATADYQLGQPDPTRSIGLTWADATYVDSGRVNASAFNNYVQLGVGTDSLLVPDAHRALIWEHFPTYNYEPATYVVGQPGFATNELGDFRAVGSTTMAVPTDVSINGGVVAIADKGNNRILLFKSAQFATSGPGAYAALGQKDFASYTSNTDMRTPSLATLSGPEGVCLDGTHTVVADTENHRVLIWNSVPGASGVAADFVLGQNDGTGTRPNRGRGDSNPVDGYSDAAIDGFFYPTGVACDGTHLAVSDRINNRVLVWNTFPTSGAQAPDRVLGQTSPTALLANRGNGWSTTVPDGFDMPTGIAFEGTSLWVADTENNRLVRWDDVFGTPTPGRFLGQPDGSTVTNPNYLINDFTYTGNPATTLPQTTANSVIRPRSVLVSSGKLFVSELDSNRVHAIDEASGNSIALLGQTTNVAAGPHTNGVSAGTLGDPGGLATDGINLIVADAQAHRVLGFSLAGLTTGEPASFVVGQSTFASSGFNATSLAAAGVLSQPRGLAAVDGNVYVADSANNRVLLMDPTQVPWTVVRVYGQPDDKLALPNSGGTPSASTLVAPRGVYADTSHVVIADTGNHRVLLFDLTAAAASVVVGQASMTSATPSAATMQLPNGICSDGTKLVVVDTSNHRALLWNTFPTSNGQAADVVIGQLDASSVLPNGGSQGAASSSTLSYPGACLFQDDVLYIADTGNNRVLVFYTVPNTNGSPADDVLGQPDFTSRSPATTFDDLTRMAGPSGLSSDSANLYVADRDVGRVLVYRRDGGNHFTLLHTELGGTTVSPLHATSGVTSAKTPYFTSQLYVSDTNASRVPRVVSVSRLLE